MKDVPNLPIQRVVRELYGSIGPQWISFITHQDGRDYVAVITGWIDDGLADSGIVRTLRLAHEALYECHDRLGLRAAVYWFQHGRILAGSEMVTPAAALRNLPPNYDLRAALIQAVGALPAAS